MTRACRVAVALSLALVLGACASTRPVPVVTIPQFPDYQQPPIPPTLSVAPDVRTRYDGAWQRLQGGDLRGATRDLSDILKKSPDLYPASASLGFVALADKDYKSAATRFTAATEADDRYVPAWVGLADAELGLDDAAGAIVALEHVLTLDPQRPGVKARLDLVRFRRVQSLIDDGRRARLAGRLPEAEQLLREALDLSPTSTIILRELALAETASGELDAAEGHARKAASIDPNDAEGQAALGAILEARGQFRDASTAYGRAAAIDPRPEWRDHARELRVKADMAGLPPEFVNLASASTVTRGTVAAFIGIRLPSLIERAPVHAAEVVTDVRDHWAAPWILPVTRAGVMDIYANHTFQPNATVRRNDLAQVISHLVDLAAAGRPADLAKWKAARPRLADLPSGNVFYRAAALAVASGAMTADATGRFYPTRPATGQDLSTAIARIEQLAGH
jgi:Tfp pilus assembly protein PilF